MTDVLGYTYRDMSTTASLSKLVNWGNAIVFESIAPEDDGGKKMWHDECAPELSQEIIGNEDSIEAIDAWFKGGGEKSVLVVVGPSGVGKSSAINLLARENGVSLYTTGSDVSRTHAQLEGMINNAEAVHQTLFMDEADSFTYEATGLTCITRLAREGKLSLILCFNRINDAKWDTLLKMKHVKTVHMGPVSPEVAVPFLQKCAGRMNRSISSADAASIASRNVGDVRRMLMDMQMQATETSSKRKRDGCDDVIVVRQIDTIEAGDSIDCVSPAQCIESMNHWLRQCKGVGLDTMAAIASDLSYLDTIVGMSTEAQDVNEEEKDYESLEFDHFLVSSVLNKMRHTNPAFTGMTHPDLLSMYSSIKAPRVYRKLKYVH